MYSFTICECAHTYMCVCVYTHTHVGSCATGFVCVVFTVMRWHCTWALNGIAYGLSTAIHMSFVCYCTWACTGNAYGLYMASRIGFIYVYLGAHLSLCAPISLNLSWSPVQLFRIYKKQTHSHQHTYIHADAPIERSLARALHAIFFYFF